MNVLLIVFCKIDFCIDGEIKKQYSQGCLSNIMGPWANQRAGAPTTTMYMNKKAVMKSKWSIRLKI